MMGRTSTPLGLVLLPASVASPSPYGLRAVLWKRSLDRALCGHQPIHSRGHRAERNSDYSYGF
jgi:hypothetical protein